MSTSRARVRRFRKAMPTDPDTVGKIIVAYENGRAGPWLAPKPGTLDWSTAIANLAERFKSDLNQERLSAGLDRLKASLSTEMDNCRVGNCWQVWYGWYATVCITGTIKQHQMRDGRWMWDVECYWHYFVQLINTLVDQRVETHGVAALDIIACFASKSSPAADRDHGLIYEDSRTRGTGAGDDSNCMEKYNSLDLAEPAKDKVLPLIPWWIANLFGFEYMAPFQGT